MASSSMLYDLTLCAACGKKGAHSRCMRCLQTAYCDTKCQKVHWRAGHKRECTKATDVAASTPATVTSAGIADTAANQSTGDDPALTVSTAATATATRVAEAPVAHQPDQPGTSSRATANSAHAADGDQEDNEHECPICWDNPDTFNGHGRGERNAQCFQCGQLVCGPCRKQLEAAGGGECPTCRASFRVSDEVLFRQNYALVHTRSPGRHTPVAQYNLGTLYNNGTGVDQDYHEAARL